MEILLIIIGSLSVIAIFCLIYLTIRNERVYRFRLKIIDLVAECNARNNYSFKGWQIYDSMPRYNQMVYSFKPLKLKEWLQEEELEYLIN